MFCIGLFVRSFIYQRNFTDASNCLDIFGTTVVYWRRNDQLGVLKQSASVSSDFTALYKSYLLLLLLLLFLFFTLGTNDPEGDFKNYWKNTKIGTKNQSVQS